MSLASLICCVSAARSSAKVHPLGRSTENSRGSSPSAGSTHRSCTDGERAGYGEGRYRPGIPWPRNESSYLDDSSAASRSPRSEDGILALCLSPRALARRKLLYSNRLVRQVLRPARIVARRKNRVKMGKALWIAQPQWVIANLDQDC